MTFPRAMSMMSPTIADAVGPAPAPGPLSTIRPTKSPSTTTMLVTPVSCPGGEFAGTRQGCIRASSPFSVICATPSSRMR